MPAQTPTNTGTAFYSQGDTYPPLVRELLNGDGSPIDLTSATGVAITISHATYDHYFSPRPVIVDGANCPVTDAANGVIQWEPQAGDLDIIGTFHYHFKITWPGGVQTVPPNSYETLVVKSPPGGAT